MKDRQEQDLVAFAKQHLDESVENLAPDTASRLRAARYEALHPRQQSVPWFWPACGFAAACLMVFSLTFWWNDSANERMVPPLEDLDLLASAEPFDLYEELDFYDWLAEHEHPS